MDLGVEIWWSSLLVLPLNRCFSVFPSFHCDIFSEIFALSLDFDLQEQFWSNRMGKIIKASIAIESCSFLYVQQFSSFAISLMKRFPTDPEGNEKSDFLLWRTTVLHVSLIFLESKWLSAFHIFSLVLVSVILVFLVDAFSVVSEMTTACDSLHTRWYCCKLRGVGPVTIHAQCLFQ